MTELVKELLRQAGLRAASELYNFIQAEQDEPTCLPLRITAWGVSEKRELMAQVWALQNPLRDLLKPGRLAYNDQTKLFELQIIPIRNGKRTKEYVYHGRIFDDDRCDRVIKTVLTGGIV